MLIFVGFDDIGYDIWILGVGCLKSGDFGGGCGIFVVGLIFKFV